MCQIFPKCPLAHWSYQITTTRHTHRSTFMKLILLSETEYFHSYIVHIFIYMVRVESATWLSRSIKLWLTVSRTCENIVYGAQATSREAQIRNQARAFTRYARMRRLLISHFALVVVTFAMYLNGRMRKFDRRVQIICIEYAFRDVYNI